MAYLSTELSSYVPFLLLPVRVQTKFKATSPQDIELAAAQRVTRYPLELLVRIYPDQISINRHEASLTASEITAGQAYWKQALLAPDRAPGSPHSVLAWQILIGKYGAPRALWILQQVIPLDLPSLIAQRDEGVKDLSFKFPPLKPGAGWQQAAQAQCLPDRFVVSLYQKYDDAKQVTDPYIREQLIDNPFVTNNGGDFEYKQVVDLTSEFLYLAKQEFGASITPDLPVGLNPAAMVDGQEGELDPKQGLSGDLTWMADFNQAVTQGMAVSIPLTQAEYDQGFKRLVVLGVRDNQKPEDEAKRFGELLKGHYYTDGLQVVPQGTPTNNTGAEPAGYSSAEQVEAEGTFRTYLQAPLFEALDAGQRREHRDGQRLADALGLPPANFEHVAGADGTDGSEATRLNRVLWPATFGYFMRERLQPVLGASDAIERTRQFFEDYVSGRGPVPAIRVGNEPYGILPTTQYSQWQAPQSQDKFGTQLWEIIRRLDTTWTERLNQAVRYSAVLFDAPYAVGAPYAQDFLTILGQEAASVEFFQRYWLGPNLMDTLANHGELLGNAIWPYGGAGVAHRADNDLFREFAGYFDPNDKLKLGAAPWPRIFDVGFQSSYRKVVHTYANEPNPVPQVTGAVVDNTLLSEVNPVEPFPGSKQQRNYIHWLSDRSFEEIRLEDFRQEFADGKPPEDFVAPNSLLYRLLRQAVLLRYWEAAAILLQDFVKLPEEEAELFNIFSQDTARWDWLNYRVDALGGQTVYEYLQKEEGPGRELKEYLDQLRALADVPTARLERLLAEHIDLGNYRIDAWKTGQVMSQLVESRQKQPQGTYLGAFGWLEDVVRQDQSQLVGTSGLLQDPDNLGYIHAPSINQGVAAAVLRQGYKSRQFEFDPLVPGANRMAVNLSSERVRRALAVLESIRTGGSLAAILGREFEEGLYRATPTNAISFSQQVEHFRKAFPFSTEKALLGQLADAPTPSPEQAARQVVNGLLLAQVGPPTGSYPPYGLTTLTVVAADRVAFMTAVQQQVAKLHDTLDALGDLTVGESIYQAVSGNTEQAAAVLENVAKGKFPTAPEVVHVPRTGVSLTHRVLLHLPETDPAQLESWGDLSPLARAEPGLNRWLVAFLGDPSHLNFHYTHTPTSTATPVTDYLALDSTGLQPIDLLALLDNEPFKAGSALDLHLAHVIRGVDASDVDKTGVVRIDYDHGDLTPLRRVLPLVARLRQLLATSRSAGPNDLAGPGALAPGQVSADGATVIVSDIDPRLSAIEQELIVLQQALTTQLATLATQLAATTPVPPTAAQLLSLRDKLHELGTYGLPEAHQATAAANADLAASAAVVLQALARRLAAAVEARKDENLLTRYPELAKALLGASFRVAMQFSLPDEAAAAYANAHGTATQLLRAHKQPSLLLDEWLQGLAPVREPLDHLEKVIILNDVCWEDSADFMALELRPVQLSARTPPTGGEYWLGMSYPDAATYTPPTDAISLVQLLPTDYKPKDAQRALWLDEWVEVIPHAQEDTSVVFHYDQPNTEAPQTLLLAVAPHPEEKPFWEWEVLLGAVNETLDLAKKRAVEPGSLAYTHLSTLLPALVAPVAQEAVTMTLDFRRINGTAQFAETPLRSDF